MPKKLILTSEGLNTSSGQKLIAEALSKDELGSKKIFLFHKPYDSIKDTLVTACMDMGFQEENIYFPDSDVTCDRIAEMDYIYVTEGNTFEILAAMKQGGFFKAMRKAVSNGAVYIGASAGAMIAGQDIALAAEFDENHVQLQDLEALKLFQGTVIPHYTESELGRYIKNMKESKPEVIARYPKIYAVANGRKLIIH